MRIFFSVLQKHNVSKYIHTEHVLSASRVMKPGTLMFCSPCIVIYPYNKKNQQDALFTFNLFQ